MERSNVKNEDYFASLLAEAVGQQAEDQMSISLGVDEVAKLLDLDKEELEAFLNFITIITHTSITAAVAVGTLDPETDSYEGAIVTTSTLAAMLVAKTLFAKVAQKRVDDEHSKYPVTLMAEAHVRNYRTAGDLDAIWPTEVVKEVLEEFSPEEAFMVGVVCGKSHG